MSDSSLKLGGFRLAPLQTGNDFSWQLESDTSDHSEVSEKLKKLEALFVERKGVVYSGSDESPYPPVKSYQRDLSDVNLWQPPDGTGQPPSGGQHRSMGGNGGSKSTPNLDTHFTYYSVMKDFPDMVLDDPQKWSRFRNTPESLRREIENAIERRLGYAEDINQLSHFLQNARETRNRGLEARIQRKIYQRENIMIPAIGEELRVAFFFGPDLETFDRLNPGGVRPKFRSDIETTEFMVEVTIGKSKPLTQLFDYVSARDAEQHLIMYAPNMNANWAQQRAKKQGFHLVQSVDELFQTVERLRYG
ncbi:MAG: hypothetical protein AAF549_08995 [Pseudomonadota bacterium]